MHNYHDHGHIAASDMSAKQHPVPSYADRIAEIAAKALLYEVNIAPKPGLVDRNNNGAHHDMDIFTFINSACALTPYFREVTQIGMAFQGTPGQLLPQLRRPGIQAEATMLRATNHVNTHKGAIFSLGILAASMGYLYGHPSQPAQTDELLKLCGCIAREVPAELEKTSATTHGEQAFVTYGLTGIRGEAAAGYPSVCKYGYPVLKAALKTAASLNDAAVVTLLHLIAYVDDTNIVRRSNYETLQDIQRHIQTLLLQPYTPAHLVQEAYRLDKQFTSRNISPGGSADLLAMCLMLYFWETEMTK